MFLRGIGENDNIVGFPPRCVEVLFPVQGADRDFVVESMIIDGFAFARTAGQLGANYPAVDLARVVGQLVLESGDAVDVRMSGRRTPEGDSFLDVQITGLLHLVCQRCLQAMEWPVDIERPLLLVKSETQIPDGNLDDDEIDVIVGGADMSVLHLVEDELILNLPMIPMHEDGICLTPVRS